MTTAIAGTTGIAVAGLYLWLRSQCDDVPADLATIVRLLALKRHLMAMNAKEHWSVADMFEDAVRRFPDKEAILFVDTNTSYTFRRVDEISNQIANWAIGEGIRPGSVVALLMDNRPEYIFTWLGLAKAGAIIALINTNLSGRPLIHSLTVCKARHFIIGTEHAARALAAKDALGYGLWYSYGAADTGYKHLDAALATQPTTRTTVSRTTKPTDVLFYIYTSGTTGAPKASVIKHIRFYIAGSGFARIYQVNSDDRIYCALPLYHSAGGMIGIGLSWYNGSTLVFRKKFSASRFWEDARQTNSTVIQYIGEICRFLLATPESPLDSKSKVRLALGNGLRKDVWIPFQKRFKIAEIGEFYAATEGNASLFNYRNRAGAVGYIPPLIGRLYPVKIVKFDIETEQPVRNEQGFCIACAPDEAGELIGRIESDDPSRVFDGYTDAKATEKKILRNVFEKGDEWFRTGDLLKKDKSGYFYFVDRIGDTFRWKGENVATSEVELVIDSVPGVQDTNVYGVQIPGYDGRAGMVSLSVDSSFSLQELYTRIRAELPTYAQPLFVRMQPEMDLTGTFKHKKFDLQAQGFDPSVIPEPLYFRDDVAGKFIRITPEIYQQLTSGAYAKL